MSAKPPHSWRLGSRPFSKHLTQNSAAVADNSASSPAIENGFGQDARDSVPLGVGLHQVVRMAGHQDAAAAMYRANGLQG
jgi:hypothetical protein